MWFSDYGWIKDVAETSRRSFLKLGVAALAGASLPIPAFARMLDALGPERTLSFYNTHTGEELNKVVYWADGIYIQETLKDINHILRDYRRDEVRAIDPGLLDQLCTLHRKLQVRSPIHIISGYRSPATNNEIRSKSRGVAKKSLHMSGKAIDLRIPGISLAQIRKAAVAMKSGGVGYYPKSDFVHLDTGLVRTW